MDIKTDFPMLVFAVRVCTEEGYQCSVAPDGIIKRSYNQVWFLLRKGIIERYRCMEES